MINIIDKIILQINISYLSLRRTKKKYIMVIKCSANVTHNKTSNLSGLRKNNNNNIEKKCNYINLYLVTFK